MKFGQNVGISGRKLLAFAAAVVFVLLGAAQGARSDTLLIVDVSNPNAVTFTATAAYSAISDSSATVQRGITLKDFFNTALASYVSFGMTGNLTAPSEDLLSYNWWGTMGGDYDSVNLYGYSGGAGADQKLQTFSTTVSALTGVGTINMSSWLTYIPSAGKSGDILVGDSAAGSHAIIGQWVVVGGESAAVPEPLTLSLLAVGGGFALLRWRGRK